MHKFAVGELVWAVSKDRKAFTRVRVEAINLLINRYGTFASYHLNIAGQTWGKEVPEDRVFATSEEARKVIYSKA